MLLHAEDDRMMLLPSWRWEDEGGLEFQMYVDPSLYKEDGAESQIQFWTEMIVMETKLNQLDSNLPIWIQ